MFYFVEDFLIAPQNLSKSWSLDLIVVCVDFRWFECCVNVSG